jgi:hypothetical protein
MNKAVYDKALADQAVQLLHECTDWIQRLNIIKEESCALKTRLSEAVDNNADTHFLNEAEYFQSIILSQEDFVKDMLKDTRLQVNRLKQIIQSGRLHTPEMPATAQQKLGHEMQFLENQFSNMKNEFIKTFAANCATTNANPHEVPGQ